MLYKLKCEMSKSVILQRDRLKKYNVTTVYFEEIINNKNV